MLGRSHEFRRPSDAAAISAEQLVPLAARCVAASRGLPLFEDVVVRGPRGRAVVRAPAFLEDTQIRRGPGIGRPARSAAKRKLRGY